MPKEDHKVKRTFISRHTDADTDADRVRNFDWDDDVEENDAAAPFIPKPCDIDLCASALSDYVLSNLTLEQLHGITSEGMCISIPVPLDIHPLLRERFCDDWTLESRLTMFQCIRDQLLAEFVDEKKRKELDEKISKILPVGCKQFILGTLNIHDDATIVNGEGNSIYIEIPIKYVAN